jgi:hypothetical protein
MIYLKGQIGIIKYESLSALADGQSLKETRLEPNFWRK